MRVVTCTLLGVRASAFKSDDGEVVLRVVTCTLLGLGLSFWLLVEGEALSVVTCTLLGPGLSLWLLVEGEVVLSVVTCTLLGPGLSLLVEGDARPPHELGIVAPEGDELELESFGEL